jgi:hypothetical protein
MVFLRIAIIEPPLPAMPQESVLGDNAPAPAEPTDTPPASPAERIATVRRGHGHGLDVKLSPHGNRHH